MSLLMAAALGFAQIQVFGFDVRDLLESKSQIEISEIKEGDCLRGPEIQKFIGAENLDVYYTFDCGVAHPTEGEMMQTLACGVDINSGGWVRSTAEHSMPGVFFPGSAPCMSSVTSLDYIRAERSNPAEGLACAMDSTQLLKEHSETMRTKKYGIGQGEAFLPSPLTVKDIDYSYNEDGSRNIQSCLQAEFIGEYKGWGSFQIQWKRTNCLTHQDTECFVAKVGQSKDAQGRACALVKKKVKCGQRLPLTEEDFDTSFVSPE